MKPTGKSTQEGERERAQGLARALHEEGVPTRKVGRLVERALGGPQRGTSRSAVSRDSKEAGEEDLRWLSTRRFDEEPIVAVVVDGTGFGNRNDKRTILIAVGLTADGRKVALTADFAQHENSKDVARVVRDLVERGVDPRALWIHDWHEGLWAGIDQGTGGAARHQLCTLHAARAIVKTLPDEVEAETKELLYQAWRENDDEVAVSKQSALADKLEAEGHEAAAKSVRRWMRPTVTLNELDVPFGLRRQMRTTNQVESANSGVKRGSRDTNRWRNDEHRRRAVAKRLRKLEDEGWTRLSRPEGLVDLMGKLMPGRHDPEAALARLPASVWAEEIRVPFDDSDGATRKLALEWVEAAPGAAWDGSTEILARLGLKAGDGVGPDRLLDAMRSLDPATGKPLRAKGRISPDGRSKDGKENETVPGVRCLGWELDAPPLVVREWSDASPARRRELEAAVRRAGRLAVAELTGTTEPSQGFAGATALLTREAGDGTKPRLAVTGIVVAVARGKTAQLNSPATGKATERRAAQTAEDAARAAFDATRNVARAPAQAETASAPASREPEGELLAAAEELALWKAPGMVGLDRDETARRAGTEAERRDLLGEIGPEIDEWLALNKDAAAGWIAGARGRLGTEQRRADVWRPLTSRARMVLGEARAQELLGEAARMRGRADVNPALAGELERAADGPAVLPDGPIAKLDRVAEGLAASRELERRAVLESALAAAAAAPATEPGEPRLFDRSGRPVLHPVERYRGPLGGRRADLLLRYAAALAPELRSRPDGELRAVAAATDPTWGQLDAKSGTLLGLREARRDAVLVERLTTQRQVGRSEEVAAAAAAGRRGGEYFAAAQAGDALRERAAQQWAALRELGGEIDGRRLGEGGPQEMLARSPSLGLNQAARRLLLERGLAATQTVEPAVPARAAGPEIGL